jgi:general stress protein 26
MLEKVKRLVQEVKVVYVATSDKEGVPHLAAAEGMTFAKEDQIVFKAWFCLKTVENLGKNPKLSLAILHPVTREGYQILGEIEQIEKGGILDGFRPKRRRNGQGIPRLSTGFRFASKRCHP